MATTRQEVIDKVGHLVTSRFGGDYKKAFDHYDSDVDGTINTDELEQILSDAQIGFKFTRWFVAQEVMLAVDPDGDGKISWTDFQSALGK